MSILTLFCKIDDFFCLSFFCYKTPMLQRGDVRAIKKLDIFKFKWYHVHSTLWTGLLPQYKLVLSAIPNRDKLCDADVQPSKKLGYSRTSKTTVEILDNPAISD